MFKKIILLVFSFNFFNSTVFALNSEVGKLFFSEEKKGKQKIHEISIQFSKMIDNNLIESESAGPEYKYILNSYLKFGISSRFNFIKESKDTIYLQRTLSFDGINQILNRPDFSIYSTMSITPINGKINSYNKYYLSFKLNIEAGLGATRYTKESTFSHNTVSSVFIAGHFNFNISKNIFVRSGLKRTVDGVLNAKQFSYTDWTMGIGIYQ